MGSRTARRAGRPQDRLMTRPSTLDSCTRTFPHAPSLRDLARKSVHDPLTSINSRLASRDGPSTTDPPARPMRSRYPAPPRPPDSRVGPPEPRPGIAPKAASASAERTSRESAERMRGLELIRRKKREMEGRGARRLAPCMVGTGVVGTGTRMSSIAGRSRRCRGRGGESRSQRGTSTGRGKSYRHW